MGGGKLIDLAAFQSQKGAGPCSLSCTILSIQIQANLVLGLIVSLNALMG